MTFDGGVVTGDERGAPIGHAPVSADLRDDEPNGLFLGPAEDPDRFELLGPGLPGGEGTTWRARFRGSLASPVPVAVKQLRPSSTPDGSPAPADLTRWTDQRHLLQALRHDHLVRVHDLILTSAPHPSGWYDDARGISFTVPCLVMEWVDGTDLRKEAPSGTTTASRLIRYVTEVANAVASLHSVTRTFGNPMLHRDVKPDNVVVSPGRGAVLVDIGTLRPLDGARDPLGLHSRNYTAPEVLADPCAPRTVACDVYGLGALAYFCLVGTDPPPADDDTAIAVVRLELRNATRRLRLRHGRKVVDLVVAALAPDPGDRPSRPSVWADELVQLFAAHHRRQQRALGAAAAIIGATGALLATVPEAFGVSNTDEPASVAAFEPFGTAYSTFPASANGDRLEITPPLGDDRFDHLWGFYSPAEACATTIEFDVVVEASANPTAFGIGVVPRAVMEDDQPTGSSVQYEWEDARDFGRSGSYARAVELPGGAWRATIDPAPMPDIHSPHHVVVRAVGTTLSVDVDGTTTNVDTPGVECGGVALRAWGAPARFDHVFIRST
ncbi:protein kinase domain-containing protein [Pseudonocardia phyllosphaerae]|uniref:protein kinase domain-containing protein n=1 Tax=Pseudonocardia phyllosphaerae TaxID=3390502 RepID=UPI00397CE02B